MLRARRHLRNWGEFIQISTQDGAAAAAETDGEIPADAAPGARSGENALDSREAQANEQTYEGEDQEMEGGWIEDAAEDGTQ